MRILVITARYPPYHLGGYEIRSEEIVENLARKRHKVLVLTSRRESASVYPHQMTAYKVLRTLHVRVGTKGLIGRLTRWRRTHLIGMLLTFARELLLDLRDLAFVDRQIKQFRPDAIYLGHITCLSRSLMPYLAGCHPPIAYDEGGSGLIDCWLEKNTWYKFVGEHASRLPASKAMKPLIVKLVCSVSAHRLKPQFAWPVNMRVFFNDELNHGNAVAKGVPVDVMRIIHAGVDTRRFSFNPRTSLGSPLRFIVPGRIEPPKGQLDGVRLLASLREWGADASMTIVGQSWSDLYRGQLVNEVRRLCLEDKVRLMPMIPQDELAALYQTADFCFFPSYYRTGFSRVPLEAMACGSIVISYGNEGSNEIISDKHNGFLVPPADFAAIRGIVRELTAHPGRVRDIAETARGEIETKFSLVNYVDAVEGLIMDAAGVR